MGLSSKNLGHWGISLKGTLGRRSSFLSLLPSHPEVNSPPRCPWCAVLCCHWPKSYRAKWLWTEISETVSQNIPFLHLSWSPQVFCHSNGKLTTISPLGPLVVSTTSSLMAVSKPPMPCLGSCLRKSHLPHVYWGQCISQIPISVNPNSGSQHWPYFGTAWRHYTHP
jgi:hypothetical protein